LINTFLFISHTQLKNEKCLDEGSSVVEFGATSISQINIIIKEYIKKLLQKYVVILKVKTIICLYFWYVFIWHIKKMFPFNQTVS